MTAVDRMPDAVNIDDGYFNDLTQNPKSISPGTNEDQPPKAKRIACVLCRKRKLRCDGARPSCGTCARLSHDCSYDEVRKKSGPKRGYVKQLENRLAQVEELLKSGKDKDSQESSPDVFSSNQLPSGASPGVDTMMDVNLSGSNSDNYVTRQEGLGRLDLHQVPHQPVPKLSSEIVALGLEESMPPQETMDDLNRLYFERVHPIAPMIHPGRYYTSLGLATKAQPPPCLRYAMWAFTASVVDKYDDLQDHFYRRARKYVERDEMHGHGENLITVQHVQTWYLLGMLEFKMTFFPRAWMSTGRACRLALMMGLHRLDNTGVDVKQCLPPPRDWTDKEERRRTFWMCFTADRFASIGTGWPMVIDERDIHSNLPADDEAYKMSRETPSISLDKALEPSGAGGISSFAGVAIMATMFGRNLIHLHRGTPEDNETNLNGKFWLRHRALDNTLLNIALALPDHLRMPIGINDQNTIFTNLCIHTSTICLHQAAIFKADSHRLPANVAAESKIRCITAAAEIASIMRMISHMDLSNANPFSSFCLYVAARVFVQYLKSRPNDNNVKASLHFLLTAMQAMRRKNLLTESLLVQLDIDLQGAGLEESRSLRNRLSKMAGGAPYKGPQGGCPMPMMPPDDQAPKNQPPRHQHHTFGDNGISGLTDPNARQNQGSRFQSYSDSGRSPGATTDSSDGRRFAAMPTRTKTPSTRPSPATVSDEAMDFTIDGTDAFSPGSFAAQSSHTSNVSRTPPLFHTDSQGDFDATKAMNLDVTSMSNEEFQAIMNGLATETMYTPGSSNDPMSILLGSGPEDSNFTMPNFSFSPGPTDNDQDLHTGFTPLPSGDMAAMSTDELMQFLDPNAVEMGWERGFPAGKVQSTGEQWKMPRVTKRHV
ncbi:hypothetical protein K461DRAFT_279495 [Myriangium duriaei CBS 260.36]|uniref:Zn(2)-C6 fungal-type domain-containing protein n=1 Tax=Myriangium duriaei CBS 260.36 TaxID=1168546 RepID=A0A9P4J0S0_9PEZI|nr:hypothetical protein K461DRAFT_279495 [Myriangium duriaei CBS 260.36]